MSVILPIEIPKSCLDCPCHDGEYGVCNLTRKTIDDVRPNDCPIVKHGYWKYLGGNWWLCTVCGLEIEARKTPWQNYCPFCGAKMDEEEE